MTSRVLRRCARAAARAAREAGRLLVRDVGRPRAVRTKRAPTDLVTETDHASEALIRRVLARAAPGFDILGEEHGQATRRHPSRWIIDPLDGTMNFVHGVPFFGVSIGLEHRGRPLVGVVHDPLRHALFTAIRGEGAFLNGRRLCVSRTRHLHSSLLATGFSPQFRTHPQPSLRWFQTLESRCHAVRRLGSTVLCLAYVAAGWLDAFYEQHLWPWDMAAGILLVQEAGGRVTSFAGGPVVLAEGRLVASNGRIHRELLTALGRPTHAPGSAARGRSRRGPGVR